MDAPKTPQSLFDDVPEPTPPPAPAPSTPQPPTSPPAPAGDDEGISTGRIVRLFLLLVVLCVIVGIIVTKSGAGGDNADANTPDAALDGDAQKSIAAAVAQMHKAIREKNMVDGADAYAILRKHNAKGRRATKAGIAFHMLFYIRSADPRVSAQHMDRAAILFQGIMPITLPKATTSALTKALAKNEDIARAALDPKLDQDRSFLRSATDTRRLAERISAADQAPQQAAENLLQWMALHIAPARPKQAAGITPLVFERGYANAVQAAWLYAESLRQLGITCRAVALPPVDGADQPECLVQVYAEGKPILLANPWRAVPVLHAQTDKPVTYDMVKADPGIYADFLKLAGLNWTASEDTLKDRTLCDPVNPRAMFTRVHALESLLDDISPRPTFALNLDGLPAGAAPALWPELLDEMRRMRNPDAVRDAKLADHAISTFTRARWNQLSNTPGASKALKADAKRIQAMLKVADMPDGKKALLEAQRFLTFFIPLADFDTGSPADAAEALPSVAKDERWGVLAQTLLAECLAVQEKPAKLNDLPLGRRLYGILRVKELIPAPPQPQPEPEPEPEPDAE